MAVLTDAVFQPMSFLHLYLTKVFFLLQRLKKKS